MTETQSLRSGFGPRTFYNFVQPYIGALLCATILMIFSAGIALLLPYLTGKVIDATILGEGQNHLHEIVRWFLVFIVMMGLLHYAQDWLISSSSARLLCDLRKQLFSRLVLFTPDFYEARRVGELLSRISSDLTLVQGFLTGTIPSGIRGIMTFLGTICILFFIHIKLTCIALLVVPPVSLAAVVFGQWMRAVAVRQQDALAESLGHAEEILNGIKTVQIASREPLEVGRYSEKLGRLLSIQLKNSRLVSGLSACLVVLQHSSSLVVLWYGGRLILRNELTPGQLVSFMLYTSTMGGIVGIFGGMYAGYQSVLGASTRIFELFNTTPSITDSKNAIALPPVSGKITFKNVSFRYPSAQDRSALDHIELNVDAGEVIGLVGPSGAGKSTLFSLLLRFYDPVAGTISIDDRDIRSI